MNNTKGLMNVMLKEKIIDRYKNYALSEKNKKLTDMFLNAPVKYLFGKNEYSANLCKKLKIDFVVDDFTDEDRFFDAKIIKTKDLPKNVPVVNCVLQGRGTIVYNYLKNNSIEFIVEYSDLFNCYPEQFDAPVWVVNTREEFEKNSERYLKVFDYLSDEESKRTLEDVYLFRLTGDRKFLENYELRIDEQYFEDFLDLGNDEVFVDCGGFTGDTTLKFIEHYPNYKKIIMFEPSKENIAKAKQALKDKQNIVFVEKGVSDKNEVLKFNSSAGVNCNITPDGPDEIEVVKIDDVINEPYTFIKMDLEGWEMNALNGAKESLAKYKPKCAICLYHNASDFYNVIDFIKNETRNDRKLYIRHYTQGWVDTVAFFV